jgi:hypothetical protein
MKTKSKAPAVPTIHETAKGRRYIIVNKKRIWLASNISERDLIKWIIKKLRPKRRRKITGADKSKVKPVITGLSSVVSSSRSTTELKDKISNLKEEIKTISLLQKENKPEILNIEELNKKQQLQIKELQKYPNVALSPKDEEMLDAVLQNQFQMTLKEARKKFKEDNKNEEIIKDLEKDKQDIIQEIEQLRQDHKVENDNNIKENEKLNQKIQNGYASKKNLDKELEKLGADKERADYLESFKGKKKELQKIAEDNNISLFDGKRQIRDYELVDELEKKSVLDFKKMYHDLKKQKKDKKKDKNEDEDKKKDKFEDADEYNGPEDNKEEQERQAREYYKGLLTFDKYGEEINVNARQKEYLKLSPKERVEALINLELEVSVVLDNLNEYFKEEKKNPTKKYNNDIDKLKLLEKASIDHEISLIDKVDPKEEQMLPLETVEDEKKKAIERHNFLDKKENRTSDEEDEVNRLFELYSNEILKGNGKTDDDGMNTNDINAIMGKYPEYKGCIGSDQLNLILKQVKPHTRICWVMNTSKSTAKDGGMHWVCCLIDARPNGAHSIEYYNSLGSRRGEQMPKDFIKKIEPILQKLKTNNYMKVKQNTIADQNNTSSNCGEFCCRFLIQRLRNKSFSDATNWDKQGEKKIEEWKLKQPEFKLISAFYK